MFSLFSLVSFLFSPSLSIANANLMMSYTFIDPAANNQRLLKLINTKLAEISATRPEPSDLNSGDLLADIGDYLVRSFAILSELSVALANGTHISEYVDQGIQHMAEKSDFSDMDLLTYMNDKHKSLQWVNFPSSE